MNFADNNTFPSMFFKEKTDNNPDIHKENRNNYKKSVGRKNKDRRQIKKGSLATLALFEATREDLH